MNAAPSRLRTPEDEYHQRGFLAGAFPLADPSIVNALLADEPIFGQALEQIRAEGRKSVPYLLTEAICRVAQDGAILEKVAAILGTSDWVMWGANIRRATPNQASFWHVDLESALWPTVTVAVGLAGCTPESATWCLPGSHRRPRLPLAGDRLPPASEAQQIAGFRDASFYVFNARMWHRGDPATSRERVILFLHYQPASAPRIPQMEDYERHRWARVPAAYFTTIAPERVCRKLARLPWRYRLNCWARQALGR